MPKWLRASLAALGLLLCCALVLHHDIQSFPGRFLHLLSRIADWSNSHGTKGALVLGCAITATTTIPIPGYSALLIICGFCYGLAGFLVTGPSALLGGLLGFLLTRHFMRSFAIQLIRAHPKLQALDEILSQGRVWPIVLFRMAPYPFCLTSYALSLSAVTFKNYAIATALSVPKQFIHIIIGKSCRSLRDVTLQLHNSSGWLAVVFISTTILVTLLIVLIASKHSHVPRQQEMGEVVMTDEDKPLLLSCFPPEVPCIPEEWACVAHR